MKEEQFSNSSQSLFINESRCWLYLEVEDAEIEYTVVNLNPRVNTVIYQEHR